MRLRPEAKVGLIAFLAFVTLIAIYAFFGGIGIGRRSYTVYAKFNDVLRLATGAEVRMAGVRIGRVSNVSLSEERNALITMQIQQGYRDTVPTDSTARITTGGLTGVGEYYVEILPGASRQTVKDGEYLNADELPKLDDLVVQVQGILKGLHSTVESVDEMLDDPETRQALKNVVKNVEESTAGTKELVARIRGVFESSAPGLNRTMAQVSAAADDFAAMTRNLRVAIERGGAADIERTLASAAKAAENVEAATAQLRALAEDEKVNAELRETISNAAEASRGAAEIVGKVEGVLGRRKDRNETPRTGTVPGKGSRLDVLAGSGDKNIRVDYNLTVPGSNENFYRIGLFDIGESTKLNLQLGKTIDYRSSYRYGLYAGRIGLGYDRLFDSDLALQLDLYHPNDPKLEAKLRYDFSPNLGAWVGFRDAFHSGDPIFGIQYSR